MVEEVAVDKDQVKEIIRAYLVKCEIDLDVSFSGDRVAVKVRILNPEGGVLMQATASDSVEGH